MLIKQQNSFNKGYSIFSILYSNFLALPHNFINKIALLLKNYIIFLNKELVTSFLKGIKATALRLRW